MVFQILNEDNRKELLTRSRSGQYYKTDQSKGRNRFERRTHSKISNSVATYNKIKQNILDVYVLVQGETDEYEVRMSFGNFSDILQNNVKGSGNKLDYRAVTRALIDGFNQDQVYIHCSCPDWRYRMDFWANKNNISSNFKPDDPMDRPSDITNPHDRLGAGCKHTLLVLNNTTWLLKVAAVIMNYIKYMEKHNNAVYTKIIYPFVYGTEYENRQFSIFDDEEEPLATDVKTIQGANTHAGRDEKGRWASGNEYQARPRSDSNVPNQTSIEDTEEQ